MHRHFVQSSVFKSAGYDPEAKVLELEFLETGDVWHYFNLPPVVYKKFIHSASLGHFFQLKIKNKYPEIKVG